MRINMANFPPPTEFSWSRKTRFGVRHTKVYTHDGFPDGTVYWQGTDFLWLGSKPTDPVEEAGRDARRFVREGMADVLAWLGQPVLVEPTTEEILTDLRATKGESRFVFQPAHNRNLRY